MHVQTHYDNSYVSHYKMAIFSCMSNTPNMWIETKDYPSKVVKKEQIMTTTLSWNETLSPIAIK